MFSISKISIFFLILTIAPDVLSDNHILKQMMAISGGLANSFNKNMGNSQINVVAGGRRKPTAEPFPEKALAGALKVADEGPAPGLRQPNSTQPDPSSGGSPDAMATNFSATMSSGLNLFSKKIFKRFFSKKFIFIFEFKADSQPPDSQSKAQFSSGDAKIGNKVEKKIYTILGGTANSMNENSGNSFINVQNLD